jgi:hypothetical protein
MSYDGRPVALHREGQKLNDQPGAIAIYDEPGQTIGLGVDQAIRIRLGIGYQRSAQADSSLNAGSPELIVDHFILIPAQDTHYNLRAPVNDTPGNKPGVAIPNVDNIPIRRIALDALYRARENPGMAVKHRFFSTLFQDHLARDHSRILYLYQDTAITITNLALKVKSTDLARYKPTG